ncbi:dihydroorotate dehydrogenase electron transfer subunit [Halobacillus salinus]|uniref:Dihydroorotate dehydrogenase B (NAD(+)), electron transfer subunit n=1 Tax=Halobacillus salinus TaxID=192814 RepID=A0A4Z0H4E7_9BACI|nr:dihydroorotate dehydrogenase electron transfer subunit [Halobacillus salinus]TGB04980.1 dihydroorotate dehydrogenase electron transfer subunit [Halobacillus salinus]
MKREWMTIIEHEPIARNTFRLVLQGTIANDVREPGQFVHIQVSNDFYLRRPVSIAEVDREEGKMTLLYKLMGKGTEELSNKHVGDTIDVLGPAGSGFPLDEIDSNHALLIGGGIGVPPLYQLAKQLHEKGVPVTSVLGFQSKEEAFFTKEFEEYGDVRVVTNDGTLGHRGLVTDVLEGSFDTYFACGPTAMLRAVSEKLDGMQGYLSMEERMGCGIGACLACVVPANDEKGYRRICCDGPVFDAKEVVLS